MSLHIEMGGVIKEGSYLVELNPQIYRSLTSTNFSAPCSGGLNVFKKA